MKVNVLFIIKNIVVFLLLFYVDAQLLDKLFTAKGMSDIIVYLVSLFFMLTILVVCSHLFYQSVTPPPSPKEKEAKND